MSIIIVVNLGLSRLKSFISVFGFQGTNVSQQFYQLTSGDGEIRTLDPLLAWQVLSQLSYTPTVPISVI